MLASTFRRSGRLFAAAGLTLLLACSQQPQTHAAAQAGAAASDSAPAKKTAKVQRSPTGEEFSGPTVVPPPQPPDGKWLVDEQGRQYFVDTIPKQDNGYAWLNEEKTQVQVRYGAIYDVVGEDATSFRVKIYRADPNARPPTPKVSKEELEKVATTYRNNTGTADRLQFEPFGRGLPESGQWRNGFEIADMNGDGYLDIVHGPARKRGGGPNIFLGDGKGNWRRWSEARFPPLPYDYGDVAVADFNGDGRLDLALAVHLHGIIALVADGPASFKEWGRGLDFHGAASPPPGEITFSSRAITAADMNGDGRLDIVAEGEGPRPPTGAATGGTPGRDAGSSGGYGLVVYLNQGDGTWVRRADEPVRLFGDKVVVADFTHDGILDTILGSNVLGAKEILRIGTGGGAWTKARLEGLRPAFVGDVNVADYNGDGRPDLAVGYLSYELKLWRSGIDLFLGRADGTWERRPVAVEDGRSWVTALATGDIDGDGKLDLAALTGEGATWILLGKGDGTFVREKTPEIPPDKGGCKGYDVRIADLDGQPGGEVVAEFAGEPSVLFAPAQCVDEGKMVAWRARKRR